MVAAGLSSPTEEKAKGKKGDMRSNPRAKGVECGRIERGIIGVI